MEVVTSLPYRPTDRSYNQPINWINGPYIKPTNQQTNRRTWEFTGKLHSISWMRTYCSSYHLLGCVTAFRIRELSTSLQFVDALLSLYVIFSLTHWLIHSLTLHSGCHVLVKYAFIELSDLGVFVTFKDVSPPVESATPPGLRLVRPLRNTSREAGGSLKLRCEVDGFPPATGTGCSGKISKYILINYVFLGFSKFTSIHFWTNSPNLFIWFFYQNGGGIAMMLLLSRKRVSFSIKGVSWATAPPS